MMPGNPVALVQVLQTSTCRQACGLRTFAQYSRVNLCTSVGVNGAHSTALKSIATTHAELDGIGLGEFSAWTNNLRAVAGAVASWVYASYYAWCVRRGVFPGSMFMVMGTIGAIIPQVLLWFVTDEELRPIKAK